MSGKIIGKYKLLDKLGEGGMGEVYRGVNMMVEREVAIKFLRPELASQPQVVERFRSEAITLAKLNHPNIATLYDFDRQGDSFIMVLEFVRGVSLDTVIQQRGRIPADQAVPIFCQVLDGIQHAHDFGVIHRDIKPANMMLTEKGTLKVLDFGIARILGTARMTRQGNIIGTIEYMSPEQVRGMETDARSDIYSLGMLLYEMLTGRCPFDMQNEFELMKAQIEQYPMPPRSLNPAIPEVVEQAIWRSIQKDPAQRFQSASEFRAFLLTAGFAATGRLEPLAVGDPNPYATRPLNTQPPASNPNLGFATVPSQSGFQTPTQAATPSQPGTSSQPGLSSPTSQPGLGVPSNPGLQPPPAQHVSNPGADTLGAATLIDAQPHSSKETRVDAPAQLQQEQQPDALKATRIGAPPVVQQPQQFAGQFPVQPQPGFQQQGLQSGPQPAQKKKGLTWVHFAGMGVAALFLVAVVAGVGLFFVYGRKAEPVKPSALNTPSVPQPTATAQAPAPTPETSSQSPAPPQDQTTSTQTPAQPQGGDSTTQTPPTGYVPITPTEPAGGDKPQPVGGTRASAPAPRPTQPPAPRPTQAPQPQKRCACGCACGDSRCLAKCALDN